MPLRQDRVRLIALIKKADGVSKEEFSRYWAEEHSHIFKANPVAQKNLLKYEQVSSSWSQLSLRPIAPCSHTPTMR